MQVVVNGSMRNREYAIFWSPSSVGASQLQVLPSEEKTHNVSRKEEIFLRAAAKQRECSFLLLSSFLCPYLLLHRALRVQCISLPHVHHPFLLRLSLLSPSFWLILRAIFTLRCLPSCSGVSARSVSLATLGASVRLSGYQEAAAPTACHIFSARSSPRIFFVTIIK